MARDRQLTINRFTSVMTLAPYGKRGEPRYFTDKTARKRRWYNRRTSTSINKIASLIKRMYEYGVNNKNKFLWLTLTTQQSNVYGQSCKTDKELMYCVKKFFQHRKFGYLCICERQRKTQDIHFHCVLVGVRSIPIKKFLREWSAYCGVKSAASMLEVKPIEDIEGLIIYIAKYVRKKLPNWDFINKYAAIYGDEFKAPYSSLFSCRTFSYGRLDRYLSSNDDYIVKIPEQYISHLGEIGEPNYLDFIDTYEYNIDVFDRAKNLYRLLRRAGLVD